MEPSQQHDPYRQREYYEQQPHQSQQPNPHQQYPMHQQPGYGQPGAYPQKPGKVQAIAIMSLVDGIINILWAMGLVPLAVMTLLCLSPLPLYALFVGVFGIVYGSKMLSTYPTDARPNRTLAILQIVNIITGNVVSLVIGILNLVFFDDPEVRHYYATLEAQRQRASHS